MPAAPQILALGKGMKLRVHRVDGFKYSSQSKVIPFVYELEFEEKMIIGSDLRANTFQLIHKTNFIIQVGGSACITSIRESEEVVGPNCPKLLLVNVLEDEDDIGELIPGQYVMYAGVTGTLKTEQGFRPFELKTEIDVTIV
jgi:hypothetical protein